MNSQNLIVMLISITALFYLYFNKLETSQNKFYENWTSWNIPEYSRILLNKFIIGKPCFVP